MRYVIIDVDTEQLLAQAEFNTLADALEYISDNVIKDSFAIVDMNTYQVLVLNNSEELCSGYLK